MIPSGLGPDYKAAGLGPDDKGPQGYSRRQPIYAMPERFG